MLPLRRRDITASSAQALGYEANYRLLCISFKNVCKMCSINKFDVVAAPLRVSNGPSLCHDAVLCGWT